MSSGAAEVRELVEGSPELWVELALRTGVAPGGTLAGDWRALFTDHPAYRNGQGLFGAE